MVPDSGLFCRYAEEAAAEKDGGADRVVDEDKLQDEQQAEFSKVDKRVRTEGGGATGSVRNLRLREDTAKYLHNLDPNSAHYDPKSRSMRADPLPEKAPHEKTFAGDNATRGTGDFEYWRQLTEHSVLEGEKGSSMHVQVCHLALCDVIVPHVLWTLWPPELKAPVLLTCEPRYFPPC